MNSWELQFYRQLSHAEPGESGFAALDACLTEHCMVNRHAALEAALRQALMDTERAHSD